MASATGIPQQHPIRIARDGEEEQPLLGRPGAALQREGKPLAYNLVIGTGVVAQAGIWLLFAVIWGAVFSHPLILFSAHPLLNSTALILLSQSILLLQPTHTPAQKRQGTLAHFALNSLALGSFAAALATLERHKARAGLGHFESAHAILGAITYALLLLQALVGVTQYFTPALYGGESRARSVWKYHRAAGYVTVVMALATVAAATETRYVAGVLQVRLWMVLLPAALLVLGLGARMRRGKFGL